jgi:hypothetical protein
MFVFLFYRNLWHKPFGTLSHKTDSFVKLDLLEKNTFKSDSQLINKPKIHPFILDKIKSIKYSNLVTGWSCEASTNYIKNYYKGITIVMDYGDK